MTGAWRLSDVTRGMDVTVAPRPAGNRMRNGIEPIQFFEGDITFGAGMRGRPGNAWAYASNERFSVALRRALPNIEWFATSR